MYTVYKHTTPSKKVYIGITAQTPNQRWRKGNGYFHSPHFHNAIEKYGWNNIKHEILYKGLTKNEAENIEIKLIAYYKATDRNYGYNSDSGGNVNRKHSEETKEKIRQAHLGMKYGEEFRKKQSILRKGNKNRLGQKQSEECKRKISEKNKGKFAGEKNYFHSHKFTGANHHSARAVEMYDMQGNLICSRDSISEFKKILGKKEVGHISAVCKGKRKSAYGFKWKYKEGDLINEMV